MKQALVCLLLIAAPLGAQVRPVPGPGDPRLQTVAYDPNQVVQLEVAAGYQVTLTFAADERIENIAIGDGGGWQVTPNKRGDHVFVKAAQAGISTNLTVVTDVREYSFELISTDAPSSAAAFAVRFTYPSVVALAPPPVTVTATPGRYRVSGARDLRPTAISDDGVHTVIEWPAKAMLPAVFAIDERGQEVLVDGYMRGEQFTIDAVRQRLVFRLDRKVARATRTVTPK